MKRLKIFTIDEIHKAVHAAYQPKGPPRMVAGFHAAKPYEPPKTGRSDDVKKVRTGFHIKRQKGPEEAKNGSRL